MQTQRLLATMRGWNYKRGLALCFLAFVFTIGAVVFPQSMIRINEARPNERFSVPAYVWLLNDVYRGMLDFRAPTPINRGSYINFNGLVARLMGQRYMNGIVRLHNGHLARLYELKNISLSCERITALYDRQIADGKAFLFVYAPSQISKYESLLPAGYDNFYNENGDALLAALKENGVPVLDLREVMHEQGMSHTDAFLVTDHHWKPETGFWANAEIIKTLTRQGVIPPIDPMYTDLDHYQVDVYAQWFLGADGKRTGRFFAGVDDFSVITPKFATHLVVDLPSQGQRAEGSFAEAALDWSHVRKKDFFQLGAYHLYGHGTRQIRFQNQRAPVDQTVLWVGDSFSRTVTPFLSLVFGAVEVLDMRDYKGDFCAFYDEYNPDIVIMLVNGSSVATLNTTYDFFPEEPAAS